VSQFEDQLQKKIDGDLQRIDILLYDLKYAIDLLDEFDDLDDEQFEIGNELPELLALGSDGQPLRLDTCQVRAPVMCVCVCGCGGWVCGLILWLTCARTCTFVQCAVRGDAEVPERHDVQSGCEEHLRLLARESSGG
jgi:hypothetical protein